MSVVTEILQEPAEKSITQMIAERAERGHQLCLTSRQLIIRTGADTYTVPACGDGAYTPHYGADREDCTCTDFGFHRGELACKHLTAVALIYAARRRRHSCRRVSLATSRSPMRRTASSTRWRSPAAGTTLSSLGRR
jgi:hypothetical protein